MTENEKFEQLPRGRVEPLILKLAAPTIISMLISTLYNMADAFFVGAINASASGAITVVFSYRRSGSFSDTVLVTIFRLNSAKKTKTKPNAWRLRVSFRRSRSGF